MRHQRRPSALLSRRSTASVAHIAVRTVPLKRLAAAALLTGTEAIVSTDGLPDGEIRTLTRHRRLTFNPRQLRANQRTMNGTFIRGRLPRLLLVFGFLRRRSGFISALRVLLCRG